VSTNGDRPLPILDGHNDVLLALHGLGTGRARGFFARGLHGHLDLPRAREGGFAGGFFAVFVPDDPASRHALLREAAEDEERERSALSPPVPQPYALRMATALTATLFRLEAESGGELRVVRDVGELRDCVERGTMAAILHFEGAEAIDPQLNALEVFYRAGLRSLGLVWSRPNAFAEGVPFRFPSSPDTGPGLTEAGRELGRAGNRLGIMIDLSHLNEDNKEKKK